ncbi:hypothetical protein JCM3770_002872 [Rhodotorula araucariae]
MGSNLGMLEARAALAAAIPQLTSLPSAPALSDRTYLSHTSAHGATHWTFEAPKGAQTSDYERLEHLGDALLGAEVTLLVHEQYPRLVVGVRTLVKAALVENQALALLSAAYDLPSQIVAAAAQAYSLQTNPGVRACVFEAFLAAIFEAHGPAVLRAFVRGVYRPLLAIAVEAVRPLYAVAPSYASAAGPAKPPPNYVGALHEWTQEHPSRRRIVFGEAKHIGPDHARRWTIDCTVRGSGLSADGKAFSGEGATVKEAKSAAAEEACAFLGIAAR